MGEIKYSIITPNYNSFHLMNKYFEMLERQTYKNFEVIVIDDCSTDDSYKKLTENKKNTRLDKKVLKNKKNKGPGESRNYGIREAKGEWVTFIDSDDYVDIHLLENVNDILKDSEIDCIIYDYYIKNKKAQHYANSIYGNRESGIISTKEAIPVVRNHAACKFYKLEILKEYNIYFPPIKKHEDVAFVPIAISHCKKIYYLKKALYFYVQRKGSVSNNSMQDNTLFTAFEILNERLGNKYKEEIMDKSITDLLYGNCLIMCKDRTNRKEIIEFIKKYEEKFNPEWTQSKMLLQLNYSKKAFLFAVKHKNITLMRIFTYIHSKLLK